MTLKIGAIEIADESGLDIKQSYKRISPKAMLRVKSGLGIMQTRAWQKLGGTISGNCWAPPAIDSLADGTVYNISCVASLSEYGASTSITLPHSFRTDGDYYPQAAALVAGEITPTTISIAGQVCTLGSVAGATQYQVVYYPVIPAFITVNRDQNADTQQGGWSIEFEEQ